MKKADFISIVKKMKSWYPVEIFPDPAPGCAVDRYTAAGVRLACDMIIEEVKNEN